MSITDKHPLPWKVGKVYEYRADVHDANDKLVLMVKPPALAKGVEQMAAQLIDAMNATKPQIDDEAVAAYAEANAGEQAGEPYRGISPDITTTLDDASPPEEPPNVEPRHGKKHHRKH